MRRASLYSSSRRPRQATAAGSPPAAPEVNSNGAAASAQRPETSPIALEANPGRPHAKRVLLASAGGVLVGAMLMLALHLGLGIEPQHLTQEDIDTAVLNTLQTQALPSQAARAAQIIGPAVVRVQAFGPEEPEAKSSSESEIQKARPRSAQREGQKEARKDGQKSRSQPGKEEPREVQKGVGTGVVIKDSGLILTNLHVISGAQRVSVTFSDGSESEVTVTGVRAEDDLAVLQALTLPDDLQPATMRSTGDLREGEGVVAVGFPFDIGPSVSAGVISGFGREYRSASGERQLTNLIQFDAAANPGSSGGPLVTMEGEVVGIVTAILNPNNQRSFVGIGFAVPIENAASAIGVPPH